jgi:pimeloyl-ACP methyl ester carboxylesterase
MRKGVLLSTALMLILLVTPACGRDAQIETPAALGASVTSRLAATADYHNNAIETPKTSDIVVAPTQTPSPPRGTNVAGQRSNDIGSVAPTETPLPPPTNTPEPEPTAEQATAGLETEEKEVTLAEPADANLSGHRIEGDSVTFIFDEQAYSLKGKVTSVAISGDFNHFKPEAQGWQLADDDKDGVWTLEAPPGVVLYGHRFAFVVNGDNRLNPPEGVDRKYLLENGEGGYYLIVGGEPENPLMSRLEDRSYTDAQGDSIPYRLLVPENYDASKAYPLVVFLHGAGERGQNNDLPIRIRNGAYEFIQTADEHSYFMLIPQCPVNTWWWNDRVIRLVLELLDDVRNEFSIDPARIYATGLSMGAIGMWEMMFREPDVFAAGIAICGGSYNSRAASQIAHIPFLVFHGSDDPIVPVEDSRRIVKALQEAGGSVKYTEFEGADHMIWDRVYTNPEVINWLFSQSRNVSSGKKE